MGTTVKDKGQVLEAFTATLSAHNIEVTADQLSSIRGSSKRQAVLNLIPESADRRSHADAVYASFREHLAQRYRMDGVEAIAGAEEVFQELKQRGVRVALNTGFDRDMTHMLLAGLSWGMSVVDAVVCGDDVRLGRPAPDLIFQAMKATGTDSARAVVNIGDTVLDLEAGHNAGVRWNVGVLTGAHDCQRLERAPHTHILSSVSDLLKLWDRRSRL